MTLQNFFSKTRKFPRNEKHVYFSEFLIRLILIASAQFENEFTGKAGVTKQKENERGNSSRQEKIFILSFNRHTLARLAFHVGNRIVESPIDAINVSVSH